jgi:phospholipid/cholesterol/gamma-HCH transport system substrate-binding protein
MTRQALSRLFTIGAIALAIVALALLLFRSSSSYTVSFLLDNSSQLVTGNLVKVGGARVGTVKSIELTESYQAKVEVEITDDDLSPLHSGTKAAVLYDSLTGVAGRYLSLTPGASNGPEIPEDGVVHADDTTSAIDADQVLNSLDEQTQEDLRVLLRRAPRIIEGEAPEQFNAGLHALNPALSQGTAVTRELAKDERALRRLVTESADVVSALASRPDDLEQLTGNALAATSAIAERSADLDSTLAQLPPTLRRTNTTLVNLRSTLGELRPLVREARPSAAPLADALLKLRPIAREARPVVADLRDTVRRPGAGNDLLEALRGILPLEKEAVPAFRSTTRLLGDLNPRLPEVRPYAPELTGFLSAFGGTTAGYYDANGRYVRISFQGSLFTLPNLTPLLPVNGLAGLRSGQERRCPGAATQTLPDRSNPYFEVPESCDPEDRPQ